MATTPTLERPPARPDVGPARPRPSRRGYAIGAAIAIVGLIVAVVWGTVAVVRLYDRVDAFPRAAVPGTVAVGLEAGQDRVVYYEQPTGTPMRGLAQLDLAVAGPNGEAVALERYVGDLRYDLPGGRETIGHAMATFEAPTSGTYEITANGTAPLGGGLAIGESFATSVVGSILGAIAVAAVTGLIGLAIVIVTAVRRSAR
jgi:hypothetical protein